MEITIREATPADAVLIADVSRQTFYDTFAADNTKEDMDKFLNEQFTRGKLILEVGAPGHIFLLAFAGEEVAGYVKLREGKHPAGLGSQNALEIARLYATSAMIGKGVGSKLMQASIDEAIKLGKDSVWLCVWEKNQRAIEFYTRWGFEKCGDTDFVLGNDVQQDWIMGRRVREKKEEEEG